MMLQHKLYNWCKLYAYRDYLIPDSNTVTYICTLAAILVVIIVSVPMNE